MLLVSQVNLFRYVISDSDRIRYSMISILKSTHSAMGVGT